MKTFAGHTKWACELQVVHHCIISTIFFCNNDVCAKFILKCYYRITTEVNLLIEIFRYSSSGHYYCQSAARLIGNPEVWPQRRYALRGYRPHGASPHHAERAVLPRAAHYHPQPPRGVEGPGNHSWQNDLSHLQLHCHCWREQSRYTTWIIYVTYDMSSNIVLYPIFHLYHV